MNLHRFLRPFSAFAATAVLATAVVRADAPLTDLVDAGTAVSLHLSDLPALRSTWEKSPTGRLWSDPAFTAFLEPLQKKIAESEFESEFKDATGLSFAEFLDLATGDVLLSIATPYKIEVEGIPHTEMPLFAIFQIGDNTDRVTELMRKATEAFIKDGGTESEEDYAGAKLHLAKPPEDAPESYRQGFSNPVIWTIHKGHLLLGDNRAAVLGAIDALDGRLPGSPLGRSPFYQDSLARDPDAQLMIFFNWQNVYPLVREDILAGAKAAQEASAAHRSEDEGAAPSNPFDTATMINALGLDVFESAYFSARLGDEETVSNAGVSYRDETGIVKLLAYRDGPVLQPEWVPAQWFNVTSANFSLPDVFAEIEALLATISPEMNAKFQTQIQALNSQLNLDLKRDLIGNFGHNFITGYAIPTSATGTEVPAMEQLDQFIAIALADAAGFERAIESLKAMGGPMVEHFLKKREYLGHNLFSFTPPVPEARGFSYAIVDRWLMLGIGSPGTIEAALQTLDGGKPGFFAQDNVREILSVVPPGAFTVQHQDLPRLLASAIATISNQQRDVEESDRVVNPDAQPTVEQLSRYFGDSVSYGERVGRGLHLRGVAKHPKQ